MTILSNALGGLIGGLSLVIVWIIYKELSFHIISRRSDKEDIERWKNLGVK